jgi:polysaccharide biosynthesis protein PslH
VKLLFLTPQLPYPPHQGTTIRNYNLIRELAARHEIHLFSLAASAISAEQKVALSFCKSILVLPAPTRTLRQRAISTLLSARPDMGLRLESAAAHEKLTALLRVEPFAAIQVEGIEMAPYLLQIAQDRPASVLVFDDHNAE